MGSGGFHSSELVIGKMLPELPAAVGQECSAAYLIQYLDCISLYCKSVQGLEEDEVYIFMAELWEHFLLLYFVGVFLYSSLVGRMCLLIHDSVW